MSLNEVKSNKTYTDLYGDHANNVVVFGNPDVESRFQAHVKMEFWGEDYISLCEEGVKGTPTLKNEIITLNLAKRKLEWFKGDRPKDGSIHWRETLKEKPASNKWSLKIADANQFDYCYQTPFAEKSARIPGSRIEYGVRDGVEYIYLIYPEGGPSKLIGRPLDVDGSIAVWHKTKRDHIIGGKNYRAGKVLHILRPKAVGANNKWVWCDIKIENGVYARTIPWSLLNDPAAYPIVTNDTFGYWSTPGTLQQEAGGYQSANGPFSPASDGSATSITIYAASVSGNVSVTLGIWNDNAGVPGTLAKDTAAFNINPTPSWNGPENLDDALDVFAANSYHLGRNSAATMEWWFDEDSFTQDNWYDADAYDPGNLDDFNPTLSQSNKRYGIYVTYTPSGATETKVFTSDAWLTGVNEKTFAADSWLQETYAKNFTTDAYLQKVDTKAFTADCFLQKTSTKGFTADAYLAGVIEKALTTDTFLQKTDTKIFTSDAWLQKTAIKTFTVDSFLQKTALKAFTCDAYLEAAWTEETKQFTVDVYLEATLTKDFTFDAYLKVVLTKAFAVDAFLAVTLVKSLAADAWLLAAYIKSFACDAQLAGVASKTFSCDSYLQATLIKTLTTDCWLANVNTKGLTSDAYLETTEEKTLSADAILQLIVSKDFSTDAFLVAVWIKQHTADAWLVIVYTKAFTVDAWLYATNKKEFTTDAILSSALKSFTVDAFILRTQIKTLTCDSILAGLAPRERGFYMPREKGKTYKLSRCVLVVRAHSYGLSPHSTIIRYTRKGERR